MCCLLFILILTTIKEDFWLIFLLEHKFESIAQKMHTRVRMVLQTPRNTRTVYIFLFRFETNVAIHSTFIKQQLCIFPLVTPTALKLKDNRHTPLL